MCKMKDVSVGIKDMDFKTYRGKMAVRLTDGRYDARLLRARLVEGCLKTDNIGARLM